jgi:hypothetical protein
VISSVYSSVYSSVCDPVCDPVCSSVYSSVCDPVCSSVYDAVYSSVYDPVYDPVRRFRFHQAVTDNGRAELILRVLAVSYATDSNLKKILNPNNPGHSDRRC